jgi:hypothetical protein
MSESKPHRSLSKSMPGPPHLRFYTAHRLVAWQPLDVLDDRLLDDIVAWILIIEKTSTPFNRFIDFSRLTKISVHIDHVFEVAQERAETFAGATPVRTAIYCNALVGFGIARLYESLMEGTPIKVSAFRDLPSAAEWLSVPAAILTLSDDPASHGEPRKPLGGAQDMG